MTDEADIIDEIAVHLWKRDTSRDSDVSMFMNDASDIFAIVLPHLDAQAAEIARLREALNIGHTAFADCDPKNRMHTEAICIMRAALAGDAIVGAKQ